MHLITKKGILLAVLCVALGAGLAWAAESLVGTYTLQGMKGPITLVLKQEADGKVSGTLSGGDLALVLKGLPQPNGMVVGATATAQGKFTSYFQASRVGDQLALDLIEANAKNEPDMNKKTRIPFPMTAAGGAASASAPSNVPASSGAAATAGGALVPGAPAAAAAAGFGGTFTGDGLTLESLATATGYSGTIKMGDQSFSFSARSSGDTLTGAFASADGKFDFVATLRGAALQLQTGGTTYNLNKQGMPVPEKPAPANPLAKGGRGGGAAPAAAAASAPALGAGSGGTSNPPAAGAVAEGAGTQPQGGPGQGADWKVFKHATGLSMRYPSDWTTTQLPNALQIVPPNVATNAGGPTEVYVVLAEGAQGIASPEDPRIIQYFGQEMAKFAPFLRPSGQQERISAGAAPGVLLTWEGSNPMGMVVRARMCVTILKGYAVALLALGDRAKLAERDTVVRGIFSSFAAGVGERDPSVVGAWKFWSYKSSADGKYGTTTDRRFVLQPDGSCSWSSSCESSGSFSGRNSLGETTWTGGVASQSNGGGKRGQWSAGNGSLHVLWNDGCGSVWDYQVGGVPGNRRLHLKGSGDKPDEWVEVR